jgi:hypothetical protein
VTEDYNPAHLRRLAADYQKRASGSHDAPTARILTEIADELLAEAEKLDQAKS